MKIRNGFVSNSSSSSFVLIVKEEDHLKALDNLNSEFEKKFLNEVMSDEKKFGTNFKFYFGSIENGLHSTRWIKIDDEYKYNRYELDTLKENSWNNYVAMLKKLGIDYFYFSQYF